MKYLALLLILFSFSFSSVDAVLKLNDNKTFNATFYNQCELPAGVDSNSIDSLGISHIYLIIWNYSYPYYFKTDILTSNLVLNKEKLQNKIEDIGDVKNIGLEQLNDPPQNFKIMELILEE